MSPLDVTDKVVLGSQSPRRKELLELIVPAVDIVVCPPKNADEPGFDGLHSTSEIIAQLQHIARLKNADVAAQLPSQPYRCILTADTVIVAAAGEGLQVLGKPDGPQWQARVKSWFREYLCGRQHSVISAVCISTPKAKRCEVLTTTTVQFAPYDEALVDWYLSTKEPLGKAGGYGIQSAGSIFAEQVNGSLSNVIGLPLQETRDALSEITGESR